MNLPHCEDIEFSAYDLDERDWSVLMVILELSLFVGRASARIPRQYYFAELTGISAGNISTILKRLERNDVISVDAQMCYTVRPARCWRMKRRVKWTVAVKDRLEWLMSLEPDSTVREPELPDFPREPEGLASVVAGQALPQLRVAEGPGQEGPAAGAARADGESAAPTLRSLDRMGQRESEEDSRAAALEADFAQRLGHMRLPVGPAGEVPTVGSSSHGGKVVVPTVGTSVQSAVQLHVHCSTASDRKQLDSEQLLFSARAGTRESEVELLGAIERFVGAGDMRQWGGNWLVHWVRKFDHEVIRAALRDIHAQMREGRLANKAPGAWIKDTIRRFA